MIGDIRRGLRRRMRRADHVRASCQVRSPNRGETAITLNDCSVLQKVYGRPRQLGWAIKLPNPCLGDGSDELAARAAVVLAYWQISHLISGRESRRVLTA